MAIEEFNSDKSKIGFSGLSSMVSNIEVTIQTVESQTNTHTDIPEGEHIEPISISKQKSMKQTIRRFMSDPMNVIALIVTFGILFFLSQENTSSHKIASQPSTNKTYVQKKTIKQQQQNYSSLSTSTARPSEKKPFLGRNNYLDTPQIRWCLAERIRIDAARDSIDKFIDSNVQRFNEIVNDYNSRCGSYRYYQRDLNTAKSEIEAYRSEIFSEGIARFLRPSVNSLAKNKPLINVSLILEIQKKLKELGYDIGTPNGQMGIQTKLSIIQFQHDVGVQMDGLANSRLLENLNAEKIRIIRNYKINQNLKIAAKKRKNQYENKRLITKKTIVSRMPVNAEIDYTGHAWTCKRGYKQIGSECVFVRLPPNSEIDYTGHNWTCKRGYYQTGSACSPVKLPSKAEIDYTGHNWTCKRGYYQTGSGCSLVKPPSNAEIDYTGHNWTCKRGYYQTGSGCSLVKLPSNAEIDYTGHNWTCKRGYYQRGSGCSPVKLPVNAEIDYTGHNWSCLRGFRQLGQTCQSI